MRGASFALLTLLAAAPAFGAAYPCEPRETWKFTSAIPEDARAEFRAFVAGRASAARSFSEALAYRRDTPPGAPRLFSQYWLARTLGSSGLAVAAHAGFASIVEEKPDSESAEVQLAALGCLNGLGRAHPALELPPGFEARLDALAKVVDDGPGERVLHEAALRLFLQKLERNHPAAELRRTLALLKGSGAPDAFASGVWAVLSEDHARAASELERFLNAQAGLTSRVPWLDGHLDTARLLAARAYYRAGDFAAATRQLKAVRKSSNELPKALSELSWSALLAKDYGEAIGSALNLQAGGLRRTFAPEAPMVLSMAMNELCQFPEALRAVDNFRRSYEPSHRWLTEWRGLKDPDLRALAFDFLRKKKTPVPDRVASEWVRSPVFIAFQDELNLLIDESEAVTRMSRLGAKEQKAMGRALGAEADKLVARLGREGARGVSAPLKRDLERLVEEVAHYRRFRAAAPAWRALAVTHPERAGAARKQALTRVNHDLSARSLRMLTQLEEIAENNRLIEVEIYDGASQDIIWQNAHPDYRALAPELQAQGAKPSPAASKVWNWGQAPIGSDAWSEIWEDELGSFKSSLFDNCSSRDRYLAVKKPAGRAARRST